MHFTFGFLELNFRLISSALCGGGGAICNIQPEKPLLLQLASLLQYLTSTFILPGSIIGSRSNRKDIRLHSSTKFSINIRNLVLTTLLPLSAEYVESGKFMCPSPVTKFLCSQKTKQVKKAITSTHLSLPFNTTCQLIVWH